MGSIHIFINQANRHYEIKVKVIDDVSDLSKQNYKSCVFKVSDLNVHGSEFYSPPNIAGQGWRRFESEGIPVGGLQIFKMS
jgi:hypothetical protein